MPIVPRVPVLRRITWGMLIFAGMGEWGLAIVNVPVGMSIMVGILFMLSGVFAEAGSWEACECECCDDGGQSCCIHCGDEMAVGLFCPNEDCRPERFEADELVEDPYEGLEPLEGDGHRVHQ